MEFMRAVVFDGGDGVGVVQRDALSAHQRRRLLDDLRLKLPEFRYLLDVPGAQSGDRADSVDAAVVHELGPDGRDRVVHQHRVEARCGEQSIQVQEPLGFRSVQLADVGWAVVGVTHLSRREQVAALKTQARQHATGTEGFSEDLDVADPVLQRQAVAVLLEHPTGGLRGFGGRVGVDADNHGVRFGRFGGVGRGVCLDSEGPGQAVEAQAAAADGVRVLLPDVHEGDPLADPSQVPSVDATHVAGPDHHELQRLAHIRTSY